MCSVPNPHPNEFRDIGIQHARDLRESAYKSRWFPARERRASRTGVGGPEVFRNLHIVFAGPGASRDTHVALTKLTAVGHSR